jgi:MFS family permease
MPDNMSNPTKPLFVVIFLISGAIGCVMLLSPVYAEEMGASYVQLGLMGAYHALGYTIITLVTGLLMDRFEKIRFYLGFQTLNVISVGALALAGSVDQLMVVRLMLGLTTGSFWVGSSAITAAMSEPHELTHNIGLYNLSWIAGFAVGPFVGGFISDFFGFRVMFLAMSGVIAVSLLIIGTMILPKVQLQPTGGKFKIDWGAIRRVAPAYLCLFPYTLSSGIYFSILPGYLKEFGITASIIGTLLTVSNVAKGAGFFGVKSLVNWGTRKAIRLVSLLLAGSLALIAYSTNEWMIVVPLALYGLSNGFLEPILLNWIAMNSPSESRSFTMGIYETVFGLGMIAGPMAAGLVTNSYPVSVVYILLAAASMLILPLSIGLD